MTPISGIRVCSEFRYLYPRRSEPVVDLTPRVSTLSKPKTNPAFFPAAEAVFAL
jgi:hypothetical protein